MWFIMDRRDETCPDRILCFYLEKVDFAVKDLLKVWIGVWFVANLN